MKKIFNTEVKGLKEMLGFTKTDGKRTCTCIQFFSKNALKYYDCDTVRFPYNYSSLKQKSNVTHNAIYY